MNNLKREVNELYQTVNNEVDGISMDSDKENDDIIEFNKNYRYEDEDCLGSLKKITCRSSDSNKNLISVGTTITASGSVEMLPSASTLSTSPEEDHEEDSNVDYRNTLAEEDQILDDDDDDDDDNVENEALADISMNVKAFSMDFRNSSIDDVESSVDNLCKEAAALIASIPSPNKKI